MIQLTPIECRVLGTLIEKAQTTPNQYPLTLNALTSGCNQKNNREPVLELSEEDVLAAIDGLKAKELAREVILAGSRVNKFKHITRDTLKVSLVEMAILAEMLLRGAQSAGELRGRAERMVPSGSGGSLRTLEEAQAAVDAMMAREDPLVVRLGHHPGERAVRFGQLLCPQLNESGLTDEPSVAADRFAVADELAERVARLEMSVKNLEERLSRLSGA